MPPLPLENLQHLGQLQVASEIALILLVKYQNQYYDSWEYSGGVRELPVRGDPLVPHP